MRGIKTSNTVMWIVGTVIVIGLLGWALARLINKPAETPRKDNASSTLSDLLELNDQTDQTRSTQLTETYSSPTYGFSISYPPELRTGPFSPFHNLRASWRVNAPLESLGTPVVSIQTLRIDNATSSPKKYPLFFDAEVRVGVSDDLSNCYAQDEGYTLQTVADTDISGTTWKKFIFGDAAMMQYISGASYRTIHNGRCYALEQLRTGSAYRDDTMETSYTDNELDEFYAKTTPIVMSFRFLDQ